MADRGIIYPGQVPLESDLLFAQQAAMVGLSKLAAAMLGTSTVVNGLGVTQTAVASMNVQVAPGEIYQNVNLEGTAYSSLAADTTHTILKQGISLDTVLLALTAPGTAGFSINYLIQATFAETDSVPAVLPYYNASNPATAFSGPANSGAAQNTRRLGKVTLSAKAGIAAATGSQATPAPDAGNVGLYVVTVANGAVSVVNANISAYAAAAVMPPGGLLIGGLQGNGANIAAAGGTADAISGNYTPGITALTNGMTLYVRAANANATATPTFTPANGVIAAKTIVKGTNVALAAGDISGAGHWIELQYDLSLDKWVLLNPISGRWIGRRVITTTQVYTPTPGTNYVDVTVVGGGGSGGGAAATGVSQASAGAGGGGGGWARKRLTTGFSGVTATVGAGGAGANNVQNGFTGGQTSFGALCVANGGQGGTWGPAQSNAVSINGGGQGGAGVTGDVLGSGGIGLFAVYAPSPSSGAGGSSLMGGGAIFATATVGIAAVSPGSGGSGGATGASSGGANSGPGAAGIIIIEEYA